METNPSDLNEASSTEQSNEGLEAAKADVTGAYHSHDTGTIDAPRVLPRPDRTILIVGKTGTGKVGIARHIFKGKFETFGSVDSVTREASLNVHDDIHCLRDDAHLKCRVIIIDTNGLNGPNYTKSDLLKKFESIGEVNAIFFVMKHGRVTPEDCDPLTGIKKAVEDANIAHICFLIITGCEGTSEAGREKIIELYKRDKLTDPICSLVAEIVLVGFPDLLLIEPDLHQYYQKGIDRDESTLQDIIRRSENKERLYGIHSRTRIPCTLF